MVTDLKYQCDKCNKFTDKAYLISVSKVESSPLEANGNVKELSDNLQVVGEATLCEKCFKKFVDSIKAVQV